MKILNTEVINKIGYVLANGNNTIFYVDFNHYTDNIDKATIIDDYDEALNLAREIGYTRLLTVEVEEENNEYELKEGDTFTEEELSKFLKDLKEIYVAFKH